MGLESRKQVAFDRAKEIITKQVILKFPNYNKTFDIHTYASKYQMGGLLSQSNKPFAFFSKILKDAQTRYTTTAKELLSIVETFKEFKTIVFGQRIRVWTDHMNLIHPNTMHTNKRVMRQRLLLEEYGVNWEYIKVKTTKLQILYLD